MVIYVAGRGRLYINHTKLTYRFHLFMLAIIYHAAARPPPPAGSISPNSNYISSTRHSRVVGTTSICVKKMLIGEGAKKRKWGMKKNGERESGRARRGV